MIPDLGSFKRIVLKVGSALLVDRARGRLNHAWLSALAGQEERADLISQHVLLHDDGQFVNTFLDRLATVGPDEVRAAAAAWLRPEHRAVVRHLVEAQEDAA